MNAANHGCVPTSKGQTIHAETMSFERVLPTDREDAKSASKRSVSASLEDGSEASSAKRPRINMAKQGRPSHLSISQRRKLVRLYIYTDLPMNDIRKLIEHFGPKKIQ